MTKPEPNGDHPLAAEAGIAYSRTGNTDLSDWVELMEAVEALCPVWPPHRAVTRGEFKL